MAKKTPTCVNCEHAKHPGRTCVKRTTASGSNFAPPCGCTLSE